MRQVVSVRMIAFSVWKGNAMKASLERPITNNQQLITILISSIFCLLTSTSYAYDFAGGTGEPNDPYQIATAEQLCSIGSDPNLLDNIISSFSRNGFQGPNRRSSDPENLLDGGTLFLDEIAALPAADQSRLLAVFEGGGYASLVENQNINNVPEVAIVVSSSSVIEQLVEKGKFR